MKKVMIALITPFTKTQAIDYLALKKIILRLLDEKVDGFIVCGTTAETPTLSEQERFDILSFVIETTMHKVEIWFGCGNNHTADTIRLCEKATHYDIDGVLLVAPYYNRPSQRGLYCHFSAISKAISMPIMLYNIPSRTGVTMEQETLCELIQEHQNIVALKQASSDLETVSYLKKRFPLFLIYSGEDGAIDEGFDAGMDGLISVMGHINLPTIKAFIEQGRVNNQLRKQLKKEAELTFLEPSPSCIKYMLFKKGECENKLRLPMCEVTKKAATILDLYDKF